MSESSLYVTVLLVAIGGALGLVARDTTCPSSAFESAQLFHDGPLLLAALNACGRVVAGLSMALAAD